MPIAKLEFNLPEEQAEFETANKGGDYHLSLWEIANEIFRPARKHGYPDQQIQSLIEKLDKMAEDDQGNGGATELVSLLEQKFYQILNDNNVELG